MNEEFGVRKNSVFLDKCRAEMNNLITFESIFDQIMMYGVKYALYTSMTQSIQKWTAGIVDCFLIPSKRYRCLILNADLNSFIIINLNVPSV